MKNRITNTKRGILLLLFVGLLVIFKSCETKVDDVDTNALEETEDVLNTADDEALFERYYRKRKQYFLVANRGSSTISVFNGKTTEFITDITLPDAGAQPTYLAHSRRNRAVYVGDFANEKVLYYDDKSFEPLGEIAIEKGAFHMWINDYVNQLWVNNIVSKTVSVIDLYTNTVISTLPLPTAEIPELTENAVQHDVVISPSGYAAYVTVLDGPDKSYVVMYNTRTLKYIKHEEVGGDAHLLPVGHKLYVPTQNANNITVFSRFNLRKLGDVPYNSTHGVAQNNRFVFTTGITDKKIGVVNRFTDRVVSEIDTEYNIPHNLAVNRSGRTLFLSHSGATATQVVFYKIRGNGTLTKISEYESGLNPFGVLSY